MRVLHVLHHAYHQPCGYRTRTQYILRHQQALGIDVAVVTSSNDEHIDETAGPLDGWDVARTPDYAGAALPFVREARMMRLLRATVASAIARHRPDVVHAHSPVLVAAPALSAARAAGLPMLYEIRDLWENASVDHGKFSTASIRYRLARRFDTYVMRRAAAVITISESLRQNVIDRQIATVVSVVPNGVDPEQFRPVPTSDSVKARWGLEGKRVLAYVGTFQPYEGLDALLSAVPMLADRVSGVHVLIVGHGPQDERLRRMVREHGLASVVTMAGRLPHADVHTAYAAADALIYPRASTRTTELTTPLKPLEAMAMGKCVIVSDVKALRELVVDGVTGLSYRAGDRGALIEVCARALEDDALRERVGTAGRTWVLRERPWSKVVARYADIYRSATSR